MPEFDWSKVQDEYINTRDKTRFYSEGVPRLIAREAAKVEGDLPVRDKLKLAQVEAIKGVSYAWDNRDGDKKISHVLAEIAQMAGSANPTFDSVLMVSNILKQVPGLNVEVASNYQIAVKDGYISIAKDGIWLCQNVPLIKEVQSLDTRTSKSRSVLDRNALLLDAISILNPVNLNKISRSEGGRRRLRELALAPNGQLKVYPGHPLFNTLEIHHLFKGERLTLNGIQLVYRGGKEGPTYYPLSGPDQKAKLSSNSILKVVPRYTGKAPEQLEKAFKRSLVSKRMRETYEYASAPGRAILESSHYSGFPVEGKALSDMVAGLEARGQLRKLNEKGWKSGYAGLILAQHRPQTLLLLKKNRSGVVVSGRTYVTSTGREGLGYGPDGSHQTLPGITRVSFEYGPYREKTDFRQVDPGAYFYEKIIAGTVKTVRAEEGDRAVMTTRVVTFEGLEPSNAVMKERHYFLHGTNFEGFLGKPASSGCLRVSNLDILEITELMPAGGMLIDIQDNNLPGPEDVPKPSPVPKPKPGPEVVPKSPSPILARNTAIQNSLNLLLGTKLTPDGKLLDSENPGLLNPGPSPTELAIRSLRDRFQLPLSDLGIRKDLLTARTQQFEYTQTYIFISVSHRRQTGRALV